MCNCSVGVMLNYPLHGAIYHCQCGVEDGFVSIILSSGVSAIELCRKMVRTL